jgi:hypothetical protein
MIHNDPFEVAYTLVYDIVYKIDDIDRLVFVNDAWMRFAHLNQAPHLASPEILHTSLWDFIVDRETRLIYSMLFAKVREQAQRLIFSYRCDTPTQRRSMRMELQPQESNHILLLSSVMHEEERTYMPLLDPAMVRATEFVTICSWCKRVELPSGLWVEVEAAVDELTLFDAPILPQLSHGICADCLHGFRNGNRVNHLDVAR